MTFRTRTTIAFFLVAVLCPALATAAETTDKIGLVVAVRGEVVALSPQGVTRPLAVKSEIYQADTIQTGARGKIQILFNDATIISLARQTEMKIAEYAWDQAGQTGAMKTEISEGTFRVMGGAMAKFSPKTFTTETPTATIGIRGSMYAGTTTPTSLSVVFQGGKGIDIINAAGSVAITKPGFGTHVLAPDQPPLPPKKFTAQDMATISSALTGEIEESEEEQAGEQEATAAEESQESGEEPARNDEAAADDASDEGAADDGATDDGGASNDGGSNDGGSAPDDGGSTPDDSGPDNGEPEAGEPDNGGPMAGPASPEEGPIATAPKEGPSDGPETDPVGPEPFNSWGPEPTEPEPVISPPVVFVSKPLDLPLDDVDYQQNETLSAGGDPSKIPTTFPAELLSGYGGSFTGKESVTGNVINGAIFWEVNWNSKKAFGIAVDNADQEEAPVFVYATVSGTELTNIRVIGSDTRGFSDASVLTGLGTGLFRGEFYDYIDFKITGKDLSISDSTLLPNFKQEGSWEVAGTMSRFLHDDEPVPTGFNPNENAQFRGFAVGRLENLKAPATNKKLFMNTSDADLSFTLERGSGLISGGSSTEGTFRLDQINGASTIDLDVGGSFGSAYVFDDAFFAELGCNGSPGSCINDESGADDAYLFPDGNYLTTENPDKQISDYITWGYWNAGYNEEGADNTIFTADDEMYSTDFQSALWIAGKETAPAYVSTLLNHPTFVAQYSGFAYGTQLTSTGAVNLLTNGRSNLQFDFRNIATANAITGSIEFDQITLNVASAASAIASTGFTANFSNTDFDPIESANHMIHGNFYGPNVNAVGGSFNAADTSTGNTYLGIFGAALSNGPAP